MNQFAGLERRTARSGRDSVDHQKDSHDDLANAVAGCLVNLDLDRRPALVRQSDLGGDKGIPLPDVCDTLFAVLATNKLGDAAIVYACTAKGYSVPLVLLDFDVTFLSASLFTDAAARLQDLSSRMRVRCWGVTGIFAAPELCEQAQRAGMPTCGVHALPTLDLEQLKTSAAMHIGANRVKVTSTVADKGRTLPFGGALDFKPVADLADDPLRAAAVWAVCAALDARRQTLSPALGAASRGEPRLTRHWRCFAADSAPTRRRLIPPHPGDQRKCSAKALFQRGFIRAINVLQIPAVEDQLTLQLSNRR